MRFASFLGFLQEAAMIPGRALKILGTGLLTLIPDVVRGEASELARGRQRTRPARVDWQGDALPAGATARLGSLRFRFLNKGALLTVAPDGKSLIFQDEEGFLCYRDLHTDKILRRIPLKDAAFLTHSEDGKIGAFGGPNGIVLLDLATGKAVGQLRAVKVATLNSPFLSRDGRLFGGWFIDDGGIDISWFDAVTGKPLHSLIDNKKTLFYPHATFTPGGNAVVVAEQEQKGKVHLRFLDVASGKEWKRLRLSIDELTGLSFVGDGSSFLISSDGGKGLRLLDTATGMERRHFPQEGGTIESFRVSRDGKLLFVICSGWIRQWNLPGGQEMRLIRLTSHEDATPRVILSPNGKALIACGTHHWTLWDTTTGRELNPMRGHIAPVHSVSFSPRGDRLLSVAEPSSALVWDLSTLKEVRRLRPLGNKVAEQNSAVAAQGLFSSDGKAIAAVWTGYPIHLWDAEVVKTPTRLGEGSYPHTIALGPGGKLAAGVCFDGTVLLWETASGKELHRFLWPSPLPKEGEEEGSRATSVALSPDGKTLAVGGFQFEESTVKRIARLWETASGALRGRREFFQETMLSAGILVFNDGRSQRLVHNAAVFFLHFSPTGKMLALGGQGVISLWDPTQGKEIRHFAWSRLDSRSMAFSPNGKFLVAGGQKGSFRLWQVETGTILGDFTGNQAAVTSLAFSPDGRHLASASLDTTILLWDVKALLEQANAPPAKLGPGQAEALWKDLGGADAAKAFKAINTLVANPKEAVALLKERLRPARPVEPGRLKQLLADLGNSQYAVRDKATRELEDLDNLAGATLRKFLAGAVTPEARKRAEQLLARLDGPVGNLRLLAALRGMEVLEQIGTTEARRVLENLAAGAPGHRLTEEARASLERLKPR
jgi:WD40 repeat protein